MAQITLTLTDGGKTVYVDDIDVISFQPNSSTGSLVNVANLGAVPQVIDCTENNAAVAAKSPLFISLTQVSPIFPNATVGYGSLSGAFIAGEPVAFGNGATGQIESDNGSSSMEVSQLSGATLESGVSITGITSGAIASISGTPTYSWQSSLSFYLNSARIIEVLETGANGTRTVVYNDASSPMAAQVYVSESAASIASSSAAGNYVYVGGTQTVTGTKTFNNLKITKGTVTQATSITTGVTVNAGAGVITTVSATTAAGSTSEFTVTNSFVSASSVVIAQIVDYTGTYGTNGLPVVSVDSVASGSFKINTSNVAPTNALSGVLKIAFIIV